MSQSTVVAAIVGIGESAVGRVPGRSARQLIGDATRAALADAGLSLSAVDGLITTPVRVEEWGFPCGVVADYLGIKPDYHATLDLSGCSGPGMIHQAALAIDSGLCTTVLCVAGQNLLSQASRGQAVKDMAERSGHGQFEVPYGPLVPSFYALAAQRHMHQFGTTPEQLAEVAVALRRHAGLNPNAHKREPITVEDVLSSRMISTPLHLLDSALVSDGAAAAIVTTLDRARDLPRVPVRLLGQGYAMSNYYLVEAESLTTTAAARSGRDAFRSAGLSPADVDVAELYDSFTITVILELEDLGFCPRGEGGRFVEGGRIALGGELPVTTHGGLLSGCHPGLPGGFFHLLEAVRQLRGDAGPRQVPGSEVALVHTFGGVMSNHMTMLLGKE